MGSRSRYAVNRLIKAVERYTPGKSEFTFSPSTTKFSFADSETARIKEKVTLRSKTTPPRDTTIEVLHQGRVPILFSMSRCGIFAMTVECIATVSPSDSIRCLSQSAPIVILSCLAVARRRGVRVRVALWRGLSCIGLPRDLRLAAKSVGHFSGGFLRLCGLWSGRWVQRLDRLRGHFWLLSLPVMGLRRFVVLPETTEGLKVVCSRSRPSGCMVWYSQRDTQAWAGGGCCVCAAGANCG